MRGEISEEEKRKEAIKEDLRKFPTPERLLLNTRMEVTEEDRELTEEERRELMTRYLEKSANIVKEAQKSPWYKEEPIFKEIEAGHCGAIMGTYLEALKMKDEPIYSKAREISQDLIKNAPSPHTLGLKRVIGQEIGRIFGLRRKE